MQTDSQKKYPVFPKQGFPTHLVLKETRYLNVVCNILLSSPDVKIIGIIRNPLATLASWMGAHKEFRASWDISVEWREAPSKNQGRPEEFFGYDKWKQAATEFLGLAEHYPDRFRLLRYDHLIANPESVISDVFQFCGLNMVEQTRSFIRDSRRRHDDDPYSVYRANADDHKWRSVLPEYIAKAVCADLKDDPLSVFIAD